MAGTREGGLKTANTNIEKYGKDFYHKLGRIGGASGHTGGFADPNPGKDGMTGQERAKYYGRIGGLLSKRGKSKNTTKGKENVQN